MKTVEQRFFDKVAKGLGCWWWGAGITKDGYGAFWLEGKTLPARRVSWWLAHGYASIPDGLTVDHKCRHRACVRPDHLRLLTSVENVLCGVSPHAINRAKTHCIHGHELAGRNLYMQGRRRRCRECAKIKQSGYRKANPELHAPRNRANASRYYAEHREEINAKRRAKGTL